MRDYIRAVFTLHPGPGDRVATDRPCEPVRCSLTAADPEWVEPKTTCAVAIRGSRDEASFVGMPGVTLQPRTDRVETPVHRWSSVVGSDSGKMRIPSAGARPPRRQATWMGGDGCACEEIIATFERRAGKSVQ